LNGGLGINFKRGLKVTTFIWVVVVLSGMEILGTSVMLAKHDYQREEVALIADILKTICMLVWAAWLLGNNA